MSKYSEQYNNIEIPDGLDTVIQSTISKSARLRHLRSTLRIASIVLLISACFVSTPFVFPGAVDFYVKIPVVGSLFAKLQNYDQMNKAYLYGFTTMFDQQQTIDGITVNIKDVYCDKTKIVLGTIMSGELTDNLHLNYELYYNDEMISIFGGSGSIGYPLEDGFHSETMNFYIKQGLPEKYTVKFLVNKIVDNKQQKFMEFNIPVDLTAINKVTKDISIMQTVKVGNSTILLKNIVLTPYDSTIQYEFSNPPFFSTKVPGTDTFLGNNMYTVQLLYNDKPILQKLNRYRMIPIKEDPNYKTTDGINYYWSSPGPRVETRYGTAIFQELDIQHMPYLTKYLKINILDPNGNVVLSTQLE